LNDSYGSHTHPRAFPSASSAFVRRPVRYKPSSLCRNWTPSNQPFARGYCAVVRGRHGQWVRGTANLSGTALTMKLGLETDSGFFGIGGHVVVVLHDKTGKPIAFYRSATCAIAGKKGGQTRIADFSSVRFAVPVEVASQTASLEVQPQIEQDNLPRPLGLKDWKIFIPIFQTNT
jgi:hypothetical protein